MFRFERVDYTNIDQRGGNEMLETTSSSSETGILTQMTESDFAALGLHNTAYIRCLSPANAMYLFPEIDEQIASENLFSLHAADGTPILLARTYHDAAETADANDLIVHSVQ